MQLLLLLSLHLCAGFEFEPAGWKHYLHDSRRNATFRALSSIGGTEALPTVRQTTTTSDPMQLVMFDDATVNRFGARTLDGSSSGYYYREGGPLDPLPGVETSLLREAWLCTRSCDFLSASGRLPQRWH